MYSGILVLVVDEVISLIVDADSNGLCLRHEIPGDKKVGTSAISPCPGSPLFCALTTWQVNNLLGLEMVVNLHIGYFCDIFTKKTRNCL